MPFGNPAPNLNDPEWILEFCNFKKAWALPPEKGGKSKGDGIIVVQPDTGYTHHPELLEGNRLITKPNLAQDFVHGGHALDRLLVTGSIWGMYEKIAKKSLGPPEVPDFSDMPIKFPSHGTATASVLMSKSGRPNMKDFPKYIASGFVSGVAPLVKVIPVKVSESVILFKEQFSSLAGAVWSAPVFARKFQDPDHDLSNIGVVSISLGGIYYYSKASSMSKALKAARRGGIVVVASAGQGVYSSSLTSQMLRDGAYPGNAHDNVIAAAGCDFEGKKYEIGCYGPYVDITAPAVGIWEARAKRIPGHYANEYTVTTSHGTSYSAAIVTGACAMWQAHHGRKKLIKDYGPELIFDLFKKVLQDSSHTPVGWDTNNRGAGILDAEKLLTWELPKKSEITEIRQDKDHG